jgi:glycolate oxidase iron-sulfur subunit
MSTVDITPENAPERRGVFTPELLDRCISCGFCLPACPTYELTGVETSSPRGRINLMRALETGVLEDDDPTVLEESSFCLGCRACEPVCPAGVHYGALLEEWRDHLWGGRRRPWKVRPLMWAVDSPRRLRALGTVRRHAGRGSEAPGPVNLMLGCFERILYPRVSRDARELGPELAAPAGQGCCGALHAHNGELERGNEMAEELGEALPGTIVTTAGGCAAHLASVLGRERVKELSQWLVERGDQPSGKPADGRPRIGLQDSCHLRNGLGIWREPRELIAHVGEYVELPCAATCCGAAGSYALVRP